jgi:hypothetical protein
MRTLLSAMCLATLVVAACSLPWNRPAQHRSARPHATPSAVPVGARFAVDGAPASGAVRLTARSHLQVAFSAQVPPSAVAVTLDGQPLPADALGWSADLLSAEVPLDRLTPYRPAQLGLSAPAPVVVPNPLQVTLLATVPTNAATGVPGGRLTQTPVEIVVENSGPARPQSGLQDADMVYEYLSEYSTTRMTAIYFGRIPAQVGPVRSCRVANLYLGFAYNGTTVCSGVSDGTGGWVIGTTPGSHPISNTMEVYDRGGHFFRVGFRAAPHNLYTSGDRATRLRSEKDQGAPDFAVDGPHDDAMGGQPADAPSAPLHSAGYAYDAGSRQYLRSDHGVPLADQVTGQQLHVKNVVLLHVGFHDAGWVEDDNGGAHSVWYQLLGSGPAEVYSNGQVVHATWHMGADGQQYFDNHAPVWFTDEQGRAVVLNTGLTWVHVLGNGQERCPDSPSRCG